METVKKRQAMTAKEMRKLMQVSNNPKDGILMMSDKYFYEFCAQLCWDFNSYLIDLHAKDPKRIPKIEDVIKDFISEL